MKKINKSPTFHVVVQETLMQVVITVQECGKALIIVGYDLAIAKIASKALKSTS